MHNTSTNKILKVGLDVSMNSTGVCLMYDGFMKQYQITSSEWKETARCSGVTTVSYDRIVTEIGLDLDICKVFSAEKLANMIQKIIKDFCMLYRIEYTNIHVGIEGTSYGSRGSSTADMVIFSSITKRKIMTFVPKNQIRVLAPGTIKKFATGNGRAGKDLMFEAYVKKYGSVIIGKGGKFDDAMDATFIASML